MVLVANSARMPFPVGGYIAFRLSLNADVPVWNGPGAGCAVVLELAVLHWRIVTLAGIVQKNPVASIFGYSKTDSIAWSPGRNLCTLAGIAEVAVVL